MLKEPAPFPQVGAYALYHCAGQLQLVRIISRDVGLATIAFPLVKGASGNRTLPLVALLNSDDLTDDERIEYKDLDAKCRRSPRPSKRQWDRFDQLKLQDLRSQTRAELVAKAAKLEKAAA
jgi:hypothetical protein